MPVLQYCKGTSTHDGYDDVKHNNLFYCTNNKKFSLPSYIVTALCIPRHNSFLSQLHNITWKQMLLVTCAVNPRWTPRFYRWATRACLQHMLKSRMESLHLSSSSLIQFSLQKMKQMFTGTGYTKDVSSGRMLFQFDGYPS